MAGRWLDVPGAAETLGISTDAVRKRIARGTLRSDMQDGRRVVWLDDGGSDESDTLTSGNDALIEAKDETIRVLQEQLEAERRANEENRRIIAGLTSRIPQLEAPSELQNEPESAENRSDRGTAPGEAAEPERRSIWRRWFGD